MEMSQLLQKIETLFPHVQMPSPAELPAGNATGLEYVIEELEQYRHQELDGSAIRLVHQELPLLSAKAWYWLFPYYLRYCLAPEAQYNRFETEFLIYSLDPAPEFQARTNFALSLFNLEQIVCIISFLEYLWKDEYWHTYCPDRLSGALAFLRSKVPER